MMLNCHDATRLMSERQERELSGRERVSLRFHIVLCTMCRRFEKHMVTVRRAAKEYTKRQE